MARFNWRDTVDPTDTLERVGRRHPEIIPETTGGLPPITGPTDGGGGGGDGGGGAPPIDCPPYATAYNSPVRGWVCVGNDPNDFPRDTSGGGGGGEEGGGGFDYTTPPFNEPERPVYNIPDIPDFTPPRFTAPNANSIYADPSYQFRLNQGLGALESSAAARGVLRSGGTLKGIQDYAQNYASQEYSNIYNRALQDWETEFQVSAAEYAPRLQEWQTRAGAEIGAGNLAFQAALDRYFFGINDEFRRQQMIFNAGLA